MLGDEPVVRDPRRSDRSGERTTHGGRPVSGIANSGYRIALVPQGVAAVVDGPFSGTIAFDEPADAVGAAPPVGPLPTRVAAVDPAAARPIDLRNRGRAARARVVADHVAGQMDLGGRGRHGHVDDPGAWV
jgi:hypothetical protein